MSIPDAVRATVLRRLSQLTRAERGVLMRAAAVGRHFDVGIVAEVATRPEDGVRAVFERARDLQIVVPSGSDCYAFRHALTHEIVYEECFNGRARALHRRIVRVLEKRRPIEAVLAALAHHAWVAHDARRVLRYNELAGDRAAAVHATGDARAYYTRARGSVEIGTSAYGRLTEKLRTLE